VYGLSAGEPIPKLPPPPPPPPRPKSAIFITTGSASARAGMGRGTHFLNSSVDLGMATGCGNMVRKMVEETWLGSQM